MNKGLFSLLGFIDKGAINMQGLARIIKATPNRDVAIDMLLGQYEEPDYPEVVTSSDNIRCEAKDYCPWTDSVIYDCVLPKEREFYYLDPEVAEAVNIQGITTIEAFNASGMKRGSYRDEGMVKLTLVSEATDSYQRYTSLKKWHAGDFGANDSGHEPNRHISYSDFK